MPPRQSPESPAATRQPLLTPEAVATYLGISEETLARYRRDGTGPACFEMPLGWRYDWSDVDAWLAPRRRCAAA